MLGSGRLSSLGDLMFILNTILDLLVGLWNLEVFQILWFVFFLVFVFSLISRILRGRF